MGKNPASNDHHRRTHWCKTTFAEIPRIGESRMDSCQKQLVPLRVSEGLSHVTYDFENKQNLADSVHE